MPQKLPPVPPPPPPVKPPIRELHGALFKMAVPEGWTDRSLYVCSAPMPVEGIEPNVTVTQENRPDLKDLDEYSKGVMSELSGQLPEFKLRKSEKRSLGGRDARWNEYNWKNPHGVLLRQAQWHVYKSPTAFVITATAPESAYAKFEATLEEVVKGFAFLTK